ncbi:MAG: DUF962 domain-containing protein [Acidobacteria bacterium]|nr:DUF962 domain-containing protein [Acidobacteriota bacterium]
MTESAKPKTFAEFWPFYVRAHSQAATRAFHFAGTALGWTTLLAGLLLRDWRLVVLALIIPYPIVWFSHFFIEHNKPATFGHPAWSWLADQKMVGLMLAGKMNTEVRRFATDSKIAS